MKKYLLFLLFLTGMAHAATFDAFMEGMQKEYYFQRTERGKELSHHVWVAPFGPLGRIFSPDAIATYNDKLNLISLTKEHLQDGNVKDARIILGKTNASYKISTIFHEMGHAELDIFIENGREETDQMLKGLYYSFIKSFYKKHFPRFNPKMVFHEHFGYYRGEMVDFLAGEISNVLIFNGYNRYKNSCFLTQPLRSKLDAGISKDDFKKIMLPNGELKNYRLRINPGYIFVKGKDINLNGPGVPATTLHQIHLAFWTYHQEFYGLPVNLKDLVLRMNATSDFRKSIADCRENLWEEWHSH